MSLDRNVVYRVEIEQFLNRYLWALGNIGEEDISEFYAEDGILDMNNMVIEGKDAIKALGAKMRELMPPGFNTGKFHMLMNNLFVEVTGENTATAKLVWTGVRSDDVKSAPKLVEQGREFDDLEKIGGNWVWKKRVLRSDGGMPDFYDATYRPD